MKKFTSLLIAAVMLLTMAIGTLSVSAAAINSELEVGKSYTMSLTQANLENAVYYFDGTMNGYYYNGNTDASAAVALTVEAADGGIRFFFTDGGVKKYLDVVKSGTYINVVITEAPTAVFTYNTEATTYVVNIEGTDYYLGTYNTYKTFSASKISYITGENAAKVGVSQFPAVFTEVSASAPETTETPVETEPFVAPTTPEEILNAAYALEAGATLQGGSYTLTGVITSVDTPYSEQYKNVTVTIQVGDMADKLIQCFRLKGDGAADLKAGDTITVTGTICNYNGTVEFNSGCTFVPVVDVTTDAPAPDTTAPESSSDTGDNGVFFAAVALAVVAIAGTAIIGRKRENA